MRSNIIIIVCFLFVNWFNPTYASQSEYPLAKIDFSNEQESKQRGARIYYKMCRVCHSMKYIRYKNFLELGFTKIQIDDLRGETPLTEPMNKTISNHILTEFYGQIPPDLSVMAKARPQGPQYIYTLLTSYTEQDGVYKNGLRPGIAMPDILNISTAVENTEKEIIKSQAKDVTEFLLWASDPRTADRKNIGFYVVFYLMILNVLFYLVMKRVWNRLNVTDKSK